MTGLELSVLHVEAEGGQLHQVAPFVKVNSGAGEVLSKKMGAKQEGEEE